MEFGFWKGIKKPFFAIAPMSDVTDIAFREMFVKYGSPDVFWTEFVSCAGLCSRGKEKLLIDLKYTKRQKPIVAQFFGSVPEHFYHSALIAKELGFDGIDINMGCPDHAVEKQGAGAALMKNPKLAQEIIREAKRGAESGRKKIPVSVKTRLGYNKDEMEKWLPYIFEMEPAVVTVHGRTRKEMSKVPARWDRIGDAVALRDGYFSFGGDKPFMIGNGDIESVEDGKKKAKEYGVNGIMVGRGIFGNPFFFRKGEKKVSKEEKLRALVEHVRLFEKYFGNSYKNRSTSLKHFDIMKKHFSSYASGFHGAKELRMELMLAKSAHDVRAIVSRHLVILK